MYRLYQKKSLKSKNTASKKLAKMPILNILKFQRFLILKSKTNISKTQKSPFRGFLRMEKK